MTKSEHNHCVVNAGTEAVIEVLERPKNFAKPAFTEDIGELYLRAKGEIDELCNEVFVQDPTDYEKTRAEAADTIAYLSALIYACNKRIAENRDINL